MTSGKAWRGQAVVRWCETGNDGSRRELCEQRRGTELRREDIVSVLEVMAKLWSKAKKELPKRAGGSGARIQVAPIAPAKVQRRAKGGRTFWRLKGGLQTHACVRPAG